MKLTTQRVVRAYFGFLVFEVVAGSISILRTLQVADTVHYSIALGRAGDVAFLLLMLLNRNKWKVPRRVVAPYAIVPIAAALGMLNHQWNLTFFSDIVTYNTFLLKIIVFYTLFQNTKYRQLFQRSVRAFSIATIVTAIGVTIVIHIYHVAGYSIYYGQTPPVTYPYIWAIGSGRIGLSYLILVLTLLSGKRMLMIGVLTATLLGFRRFLLRRRVFVGFAIGAVAVGLALSSLSRDFGGTSKLVRTVSQAQGANSFTGLLHRLDPQRVDEVVGIIQTMKPADYVLGRGYGFRYYTADNPVLLQAGITESNAHFSPMGIVSKYGVIGLAVWAIFFLGVLTQAWRFRNRDAWSYGNFLFVTSMLVQSLMAFVLFGDLLLPLVIGYVLSERVLGAAYGKTANRDGARRVTFADGLPV